MELVVFDLDYTVWRPEMYQLHGKPVLTDIEQSRVTGSLRAETKTTKESTMLVDSIAQPIRVFPGA